MARNRSAWLTLILLASMGCGDDEAGSSSSSSSTGGAGGQGGSTTTSGGAGGDGVGGSGAQGGAGGSGGELDPGPNVDTSDPQLYETQFTADQADATADQRLGTQLAYLDTRVAPRGRLVVYLHGAGDPGTCGSTEHGGVLAGMGFHVLSPCYDSGYGVGNCGDDIEGCRLEAFEGVDHHAFIDVSRPNSVEERIIKGLEYVQQQNPEGDWTYYMSGGAPKWSRIIVSGISHGASSSGVIGLHRLVDRVVTLSGPLDSNQAWLSKTPMTPIDRYYGFTHTDDGQHSGHLDAFETLGLPGVPTVVDDGTPPYGDSHRLVSSAATGNGHSSTQAGGASPKNGEDYLFQPVWEVLYGAQ